MCAVCAVGVCVGVCWFVIFFVCWRFTFQLSFLFGKTPEIGILPSDRATRRYTKVHLDFCLRFSHADWSNRPRIAFRRWTQAVRQVAAIQVGRYRFLACPYRFLAAKREAKAGLSSGHSHYRSAFESFAPEHSRRCATDISEQPDPNRTDLFDNWHHATMAANIAVREIKCPTTSGTSLPRRQQGENRFPSVKMFITIHQPKSFLSP